MLMAKTKYNLKPIDDDKSLSDATSNLPGALPGSITNRNNGYGWGWAGRGFSFGWGCGGYVRNGMATTAIVHYYATGGASINCDGYGLGNGYGLGCGIAAPYIAIRNNVLMARPEGVFIIPIEIRLEQLHI